MCDEPSKRPNLAIETRPMVGIYILAKKRHFAHAGSGEASRLGFDLGNWTRKLSSSGIRHNAESAELVATFLNGEERCDAALRHDLRQMIKFVLCRKFSFHDGPAREGISPQKVGQAVVGLRTEDKIDCSLPAHDFLTL